MMQVTTGSRLHFGLFSLPASEPTESAVDRLYGGVGLMVEEPSVIVRAEPAPSWSAHGPSKERALAVAQRIVASGQWPLTTGHYSLGVDSCPPEHVGLGTGTQLSLAVAIAIAGAAGKKYIDVPEFANRLGRGQRSALGIHGFLQGGFLVEAGGRKEGRRTEDGGRKTENLPPPSALRPPSFPPRSSPVPSFPKTGVFF